MSVAVQLAAFSQTTNPLVTENEAEIHFDRADFGNSKLPLWSSLTHFETTVLQQLQTTQQNQPETLLAFYLMASGDVRTDAEFKVFLETYRRWIADVSPKVTRISNPAKRAKKLFELMHDDFFLENTASAGAPSGYEADQTKVSDIFRTQTFNCISSAMLYSVIALQFGLDVQGVVLPSHAFVQLQLDKGIVEIETTSANGFDLEHDEEFYNQHAAQWSDNLGLDPLSYADYQNREIVSPVQLGLVNIWSQHTAPEKMTYVNRMRLAEIRSFLAPDDFVAQKTRLYYYNVEFNVLNDQDDFQTMTRFYESVQPWLMSNNTQQHSDPEWQSMLAFSKVNMAYAWVNGAKAEDGLALVHDLLLNVPADTQDYTDIRQNLFFIVAQFVINSVNEGGYTRAKRALNGYEAECAGYDHCGSSLHSLYARWSQMFWQQKNWVQVLKIIDEYLQIDPNSERANAFWQSYEAAHLNRAGELVFNEDRRNAKLVLDSCVELISAASRCKKAARDLDNKGYF